MFLSFHATRQLCSNLQMLILSVVFRCVDPILTIVSTLSCKSLMAETQENRDEILRYTNSIRDSRSKSLSRFRGTYSKSNSDLLADCEIYQECMRRKQESKALFEDFCVQVSSSQLKLERFLTLFSQNHISKGTVKDIGALRGELFQIISEIVLLPDGFKSSEPFLNGNSENDTLIKAVISAGLWPRVAQIHLPQKAIKYDQVQYGTVKRENEAREYQLFDIGERRMRVFTHPRSVMFSEISGKSAFLVYCNKHQTTKVYLRDATEVYSYCLTTRPLNLCDCYGHEGADLCDFAIWWSIENKSYWRRDCCGRSG
jgi:ATP-dependent RNA helicase DHX57